MEAQFNSDFSICKKFTTEIVVRHLVISEDTLDDPLGCHKWGLAAYQQMAYFLKRMTQVFQICDSFLKIEKNI